MRRQKASMQGSTFHLVILSEPAGCGEALPVDCNFWRPGWSEVCWRAWAAEAMATTGPEGLRYHQTEGVHRFEGAVTEVVMVGMRVSRYCSLQYRMSAQYLGKTVY